mmetsp:Transcript_97375/g.275283  ORF Transcript_97375/g.275283 Transcript_97375/m.275283 type:complete len:242 (-) Transcript_97375:194-919(-)
MLPGLGSQPRGEILPGPDAFGPMGSGCAQVVVAIVATLLELVRILLDVELRRRDGQSLVLHQGKELRARSVHAGRHEVKSTGESAGVVERGQADAEMMKVDGEVRRRQVAPEILWKRAVERRRRSSAAKGEWQHVALGREAAHRVRLVSVVTRETQYLLVPLARAPNRDAPRDGLPENIVRKLSIAICRVSARRSTRQHDTAYAIQQKVYLALRSAEADGYHASAGTFQPFDVAAHDDRPV